MRRVSEDEEADYRQQEGEERWRAHLERRAMMGGPDAPDPCERCGGEGKVKGQEMRAVTRDMAIDAGDPALEGSPIFQVVEEECPRCLGTGVQLRR